MKVSSPAKHTVYVTVYVHSVGLFGAQLTFYTVKVFFKLQDSLIEKKIILGEQKES